jgi:hypothetical protein
MTDKLAEIFDIEPAPKTNIVTKVEVPVIPLEDDKDSELLYVRDNLHSLIDKGSQAVANALQVAAESQHPRAYEVAGNLIKNIGDLTDKLVSLQKAKLALNPESNPKNVTIDKAVFVGSTAELLKNVKQHDSSEKT